MKAFLRSMSSNFGVIGELLGFFWSNKRWWLIPMVVLLMLFGLLIVVSSNPAIAPFIYTLF